MIEVSRLKDLNAAELFLGFRIGAVGRRDFAVFPVQGQRGLRRLKRYFGNKMSVGAQMVVVLKAFVEHCVSLVLGHPFEFSWLDVSQTDVFHCSSPLGGSQPRNLARWLVQRIVAGHRENRQQGQSSRLLQLPQPPCEEPTLWLAPNQGQRQSFLIRRPGLSGPAQPAVHICTG